MKNVLKQIITSKFALVKYIFHFFLYTFSMSIGQVILELRKEYNLSQQKLADLIGVNQSTIAKIEIGRNEATASTIKKLADFFHVSADYIIERSDDFGQVTVQPPTSALSDEEKDVIRKYSSLNYPNRKLIMQMLDTLTQYDSESTIKSKREVKYEGKTAVTTNRTKSYPKRIGFKN